MEKAANNPVVLLMNRLFVCALVLVLLAPAATGQGQEVRNFRNVVYEGPELEQYQPDYGQEAQAEPGQGMQGEYVPPPQGEWMPDSFSPQYADSLYMDEPAAAISSGTWLRRGCWYTQQEFVMLLKSDPRSQLIAVDQVQVGVFRETVTTDDASFTFQPGARLTLGRNLGRDPANRDQSVEFTFLGLFEWQTRDHLEAINPGSIGQFGSLRTTLAGGGGSTEAFQSLDEVEYSYSANFNSYEVNLVNRQRANRDQLVMRPDGSWVRQASVSSLRSYIFGLRGIGLDETFIFSGEGAFDANGDPQQHSGVYRVKTHNDIFGLQTGIDLVWQHDSWQFGFRSKGGVLVNLADRKSRVDTLIDGTAGGEAEDVEDESLTALVEGGLYVHYYLRPNLVFRCSYDVLYLQGIALAPEQLGLGERAFPVVNIGGDTILQGGFVGFESVW